jgi:hypothetical protein
MVVAISNKGYGRQKRRNMHHNYDTIIKVFTLLHASMTQVNITCERELFKFILVVPTFLFDSPCKQWCTQQTN